MYHLELACSITLSIHVNLSDEQIESWIKQFKVYATFYYNSNNVFMQDLASAEL